jgi:HAD superfamily hydrolase (TIGR01490 family)
MQATMRRAAFFDMDRTVLRIDSGMSWMKFMYRRGELSPFGMAQATWWSLQYKLALLDIETLATRLVADLAGTPEDLMVEKADVWHQAYVADQVAPRAIASIEEHRRKGERVVLLTASTQYAAEVVARSLQMDPLCSQLEVHDGTFTGRIRQLCYGKNKIDIAERYAAEHGICLDESSFYSDSYNDLPMLSRVGTPVAVNPDARLWRHARRRGWQVARWA